MDVFERLASLPPGRLVTDVFLSVGDDDFRLILAGTVLLHARLAQRGWRSELRAVDAGPEWANQQGEIVRAVRWAGTRLAVACAGREGRALPVGAVGRERAEGAWR